MSPICHYSKNSVETTTRMCFLQRRLAAYRQTQHSCLRTMALVECHSSRSNDLSVHARIDPRGYVRLLWESSEEDAAIFEVKFGKKKTKRIITDSRERTADTLFNDLESVALAIEGSDLNINENNFVPRAKCIQDTKERQLVTRSGLPKTTVLCVPSPPRAGDEVTFACSTVFQNNASTRSQF